MADGIEDINKLHVLGFRLYLFTSKQNLEILPIQNLADPITLG